MTTDEFVAKCPACGGNWTRMILRGLDYVFPAIYKALPDRNYTFNEAMWIAGYLCDHTDDNTPGEAWYDIEHQVFIEPYVKSGLIQFRFRDFTDAEKDIPVKDLESYVNEMYN